MSRPITLSEYDPEWPRRFDDECEALTTLFAPILVQVHHVGSTAVPGLLAKPTIDILVVIEEDRSLPDFDDGMRALGYDPRGECLEDGGTPGRFYYRKDVDGRRTHHVHICAKGHVQIAELLAFRDLLRRRPDVADEYARVKRMALLEGGPDNRAYRLRKQDWVRATTRAAVADTATGGSS